MEVSMKRTIAGCLMLLTALSGPALAGQSGAKDEAKQAGAAAKEAGKDSAEAAKHAGKATAKATKKSATAAKKAVTGTAHATCVDGTRTRGVDNHAAAAACNTHGGVAKP
jgi:hypothetical protein